MVYSNYPPFSITMKTKWSKVFEDLDSYFAWKEQYKKSHIAFYDVGTGRVFVKLRGT